MFYPTSCRPVLTPLAVTARFGWCSTDTNLSTLQHHCTTFRVVAMSAGTQDCIEHVPDESRTPFCCPACIRTFSALVTIATIRTVRGVKSENENTRKPKSMEGQHIRGHACDRLTEDVADSRVCAVGHGAVLHANSARLDRRQDTPAGKPARSRSSTR